jgi:hypothetical protein
MRRQDSAQRPAIKRAGNVTGRTAGGLDSGEGLHHYR